MENLLAWRTTQRAELIAVRQAINSTDRGRWTTAIHDYLRAALPAVRGLVIGYYMPFRGEPDLRPLLDTWRDAGAETALPVVVGRDLPLEFRRWWPGAPLSKGALSLPAPDGTPLCVPQVVLMPPVGFDGQGYRLGYGGGYFDRTLAALKPAPIKIGVAFEVSRMASIDPQSYDIAMDFVITERGVYERRDGWLHRLNSAATVGRAMAALRARRAIDASPGDSCASAPCYAADFDQNL